MMAILLPASAVTASTSDSQLQAAEWDVLQGLNAIRARHDLRPLFMHGGVRRVAGLRSASMANQDYFAHVSPAGLDAGDLLRRQGVAFRRWGEAIGWTVYMPIEDAVPWMVDWWRDSGPHRALILDDTFNYAGVGIVADGSKTLFTVDFIKGPDVTPPVADLLSASSPTWDLATLRSTSNPVTLRWAGWDRRLATGTSGLASFHVQVKRPGGDWRSLLYRTTLRSATFDLRIGEFRFRIRARDWRGNRSPWTEPVAVVVQ
jgi:hypothetical protein